jgi:hypothetical protein
LTRGPCTDKEHPTRSDPPCASSSESPSPPRPCWASSASRPRWRPRRPSSECQATLNSYRAKAGLAKASSTSIPALGVAAGRHACYRVNVDPGDSIVLSQLGLPDLGLFGPT